MTEQNPAIYLQAESHPAEDVRRWQRAATNAGEGVLRTADSVSGSLEVTEKSGTPDMSVDVAGGSCLILGTEATYQGTYFCENRSTTNLAVDASDATNARYDLVVAKVQDSDYSGATDAWSLAVVTGTPAASPADPAVPDNSITLARINVAALSTDVDNADITDLRTWARLWGQHGSVDTSNTNVPASDTELVSLTFPDPGRPCYVSATFTGAAYHVASLTTRYTISYYLDISIDGGSSYTTVSQGTVDVKQGDSGVYRVPFAWTGHMNEETVDPILPTGDIVVRARHGCAAAGGTDVQTRYSELTAHWTPA